MVDLILTAVLVGSAVTGLIEFIDMLFETLVVRMLKSTLKKVFVLPLNIGGAFLMSVRLPDVIVVSFAAMLVSLSISVWLDKPSVIPNPYRSGRTRSLDGLL